MRILNAYLQYINTVMSLPRVTEASFFEVKTSRGRAVVIVFGPSGKPISCSVFR